MANYIHTIYIQIIYIELIRNSFFWEIILKLKTRSKKVTVYECMLIYPNKQNATSLNQTRVILLN